MGNYQVVKTRLFEGVWEGVLTAAEPTSAEPQIAVVHAGEVLQGVTLTPEKAGSSWAIRVPVPPRCLSDGVQTFLLRDTATETTLTSFAIVAGEVLDDDVRAELDFLRAELDLLKRAFRRHCAETS
ncbi:hypothetical protein [Pseudaestuariivita sp.]|uniref:hypothetical protein n=1 Tax=Pseudaestuariivita sp. TaxID=2211669 RepID=UPI004059BCAE